MIAFTKCYLKLHKWKRKTLQGVLGRWAWILLLKRSIFGVLDKVYDGMNEEKNSITPTRSMRNKLRLLFRLSPLIRVDLKKSFLGILIYINAYLRGGAVMYV